MLNKMLNFDQRLIIITFVNNYEFMLSLTNIAISYINFYIASYTMFKHIIVFKRFADNKSVICLACVFSH